MLFIRKKPHPMSGKTIELYGYTAIDYTVDKPILSGGVKFYPVSKEIKFFSYEDDGLKNMTYIPGVNSSNITKGVEFFSTKQEAESYCENNNYKSGVKKYICTFPPDYNGWQTPYLMLADEIQ